MVLSSGTAAAVDGNTSCYNHTSALEEGEQDTFTEFWFGDSIKHHFEDMALGRSVLNLRQGNARMFDEGDWA
jgi:hypothetical protein